MPGGEGLGRDADRLHEALENCPAKPLDTATVSGYYVRTVPRSPKLWGLTTGDSNGAWRLRGLARDRVIVRANWRKRTRCGATFVKTRRQVGARRAGSSGLYFFFSIPNVQNHSDQPPRRLLRRRRQACPALLNSAWLSVPTTICRAPRPCARPLTATVRVRNRIPNNRPPTRGNVR